jgi:uncharacterized protein YhbP (UPF0306 family)
MTIFFFLFIPENRLPVRGVPCRPSLMLNSYLCRQKQSNMDPRILRFLRRHHVLSLATTSRQGSWTAHCFYAFMPDRQSLVFTTGPDTRHGREMQQNPNVSAGIVLETKVIGMIRGIQLTGTEARAAYFKRFPFALAMKPDLWILQVNYVKMTDNRLGFGKKLEWEREDVIHREEQ